MRVLHSFLGKLIDCCSSIPRCRYFLILLLLLLVDVSGVLLGVLFIRLPMNVPPNAHTAETNRRRAMEDSTSVGSAAAYLLLRSLEACPRFGVLSFAATAFSACSFLILSLLLLFPDEDDDIGSIKAVFNTGNKKVASLNASLFLRRK